MGVMIPLEVVPVPELEISTSLDELIIAESRLLLIDAEGG